jgi:hypothetical protein
MKRNTHKIWDGKIMGKFFYDFAHMILPSQVLRSGLITGGRCDC